MRENLTPCLICEKAVVYLWREDIIEGEPPTNLDGASYLRIIASYGSIFDCNEYQAIICDDCLEQAVQRRRVNFIKEHSPFGD
jgi:hypothetical protein